jgi:hypothetical protein
MGQGARTHCDVVVKVDQSGRVLAIGGNVRGTVSLKILPAVASRASSPSGAQSTGPGARPMFAHLKLRAAGSADDAFDGSPTLRALGCSRPATVEALSAAAVVSDRRSVRCAD